MSNHVEAQIEQLLSNVDQQALDEFLASYARRVAAGQSIEMMTVQLLAARKVFAAATDEEGALEREIANLRRLTFGQVIVQLEGRNESDDELLSLLKPARDHRNYLAHDFVRDNLSAFFSAKDREFPTARLKEVDDVFERAFHAVLESWAALLGQMGVGPDQTLSVIGAMAGHVANTGEMWTDDDVAEFAREAARKNSPDES